MLHIRVHRTEGTDTVALLTYLEIEGEAACLYGLGLLCG